MGWTLNRYFFFRYAAITTWYFLGVYALVTLIDFTELSSRTIGMQGFSIGLAFAISALRVPMLVQQNRAVHRPDRGDCNACVAQPQV